MTACFCVNTSATPSYCINNYFPLSFQHEVIFRAAFLGALNMIRKQNKSMCFAYWNEMTVFFLTRSPLSLPKRDAKIMVKVNGQSKNSAMNIK